MKSRFHVYFGGSYLPPHVGHDEMLVALLKHPDVAFVHLVPTFQNPLKNSSVTLSPTRELKRKFVTAWVESLRARRVSGVEKLLVEWREVDAAQTSYTVDTLLALAKDLGSRREDWVLCLGDDCLPQLDRWKDIDRLLSSLQEVWVFRRASSPGRDFLRELPDRLHKSTVWRLLLPQIQDVSSTEIRDILAKPPTDARQDQLRTRVRPEILALLGDSSLSP